MLLLMTSLVLLKYPEALPLIGKKSPGKGTSTLSLSDGRFNG